MVKFTKSTYNKKLRQNTMINFMILQNGIKI